MQHSEGLSVIVMCGGLATRMEGQPKYLLQVTDSERVIDLAIKPAIESRRQRVTECIILASGKHPDAVIKYQQELSLRISPIMVEVSHSTPEGQFKAVAKATREYCITGPIATIYGDEVVPGLKLEDVYNQHRQNHALVTRVVTRFCNDGSSKVMVDNDLHICAKLVSNSQQFFATGMMILEPQARQLALEARNPSEFLQKLIKERKLMAYIHEKSFNVNTPSDLETLRQEYRIGL